MFAASKSSLFKSPLRFVGGAALATTVSSSTPSFSLTGLTGGGASSPSAGDIVIAAIAFRDNVANRDIQCTTSGYTEVADLFANGSEDCQLGVYYKVLSTAETTISFNRVSSGNTCFCVQVWRGADSTTPLNGTTTTAVGTTTGVPDAPSITTAANNGIVIAIGAFAGEGVEVNNNPLTVPSGMENFFENAVTNQARLGIASVFRQTAGAYDPPVFGGGSADSNNTFCAVTLGLRPK